MIDRHIRLVGRKVKIRRMRRKLSIQESVRLIEAVRSQRELEEITEQERTLVEKGAILEERIRNNLSELPAVFLCIYEI